MPVDCETAPIILDPSQIEVAGEMAARAFHTDPAATYIFRDEKRRHRLFSHAMAGVLRYGCRYGEVYTTPGVPAGVAVWLPPPGRRGLAHPLAVLRILRTGMAAFPFRCRPDELLRSAVLELPGARPGAGAFRRPHWYLWLLAVDPERQGSGIGNSLLQPVLARADAEGLPCALGTMKESNVAFYGKRGFEVIGERSCPAGGPRIWTMWREPGSAASVCSPPRAAIQEGKS
jgi:GNAT superfamily N-acetyltransferase